MCEEDPTTWENLANQRWQEYSHSTYETVDSTTGEILEPAKVKAGCDEELGFMKQPRMAPKGKSWEPDGSTSKRVTRSDVDLSPKSSRGATNERISMPGRPP